MTSKPVALVTGAGGELGTQLLPTLAARGFDVVAIDLNELSAELRGLCLETATLDVLDVAALRKLLFRHSPTHVFHLAAVLSSHAERDPDLAHRVNVEGTLGLFRACQDDATHRPCFLFPSSIAVYGLPDPKVKGEQGALKEWQWNTPTGVYGCNKLYCELIGAYLSRRSVLDFRSIRFPGLIGSETLPSGGTTDFGPEMIHAAAAGRPYASFVDEKTRLPFMIMPEAVEALLQLGLADASSLSRRVYNVRAFSCTAGEIRREVLKHFPEAGITFASNPAKQAIVDSWPADLDDSPARRDWGLTTRFGLQEALGSYLVPALRRRYANAPVSRQG